MKRGALILLAGWLMLAGSAQAANIDIQWTGGPTLTVSLDGWTRYTAAGDMRITVKDGSLAPDLVSGQRFYTFCVDLHHYATTSADATLDWMSNWAMAGPPPNSYPKPANTAGVAQASYLGREYFDLHPTGAADNVAAKYQIAIWELLYEGTNTFGTRNGTALFSGIATSVLDDADDLIASTAGRSSNIGWLRTSNSSDGKYAQDFMAPRAAVPDALSTFGAFAMGLASLGVARRRTRR